LEIFRGVTRDNRTRATAVRNAVYENGYSQKEVANFLGIHYSTISRTVKKRKCTEQDLPRILLVLLRSEAIKSKVMTWPGDIAPALGLQLWDRI
jgi:predicted XRE-type DNA-binding protein